MARSPRRRRSRTPRRSSRRPSCPCRPIWRTALPTAPKGLPRPPGERLPPASPVSPSRTSEATAPTPSTSSSTPSSVSGRPPRSPTPAPSVSCSPPGPRTTCTAATISTTRSRACRPTGRLEPTCCMPPAPPRPSRSGRSSPRSISPSTCWPGRGRPRSPSWRSWGSAGSPSAAVSRSPPSMRWCARGGSFSDEGTYGYAERAGAGVAGRARGVSLAPANSRLVRRARGNTGPVAPRPPGPI